MPSSLGTREKKTESGDYIGLGMTLGNLCEKLGAGGTYQIQEKQMYEPTRTLNGLIEMNVPKQGRDADAQVYCIFVPRIAN